MSSIPMRSQLYIFHHSHLNGVLIIIKKGKDFAKMQGIRGIRYVFYFSKKG
jgi:hypothetical protein